MKKIDLSKKAANGMVTVLNKFLKIDANSTSCIVVHQPKAPKGLDKFKIK